jgi:hypothetical protein
LADAPHPEDVSDLIEHLASLPPKSFDVECVVDFQMPARSEDTIRADVTRMYSKIDSLRPGASRRLSDKDSIDAEVKRQSAEQSHMRRIFRRVRLSLGHGYRLDQSVTVAGE